MTMQNLVLAVQNSVDVGQVGAASSLVAFLRSMGGTVGVTVLGVVLSHRVSTLLGLSASATVGTGDLSGLDPTAAAAVRAAYGDAIGLVFLIAAVASLLTLAVVLFIKEVPLRTTVGSAPEQAATGTATASVTAAAPALVGSSAPVSAAPITAAPETAAVPDPETTSTPVDDRSIAARPRTEPDAAVPHVAADRAPRHAAAPSDDAGVRDRLLDVLLPRPQEALAALDEAERAARDLADARGRLASSVHRLRTAGFAQRQIDGLLAERVGGERCPSSV
jgi:hypothetical protein